MEKKPFFLLPQQLFFLLIVFFSMTITISCGNKKQGGTGTGTGTTDTTTMKTKTDTTQSSFAGIKFPVYIIQYAYLKDLPKGIWTDKPKLLLKVSFADITKPAEMKLAAYFTKTHGHYAEGESPIPDSEITISTDESEEFTGIVIGNNDLALQKILKKNGKWRDCDYFKFIPVKKQFLPDTKYHLQFKIVAVKVTYDANKKKILTEEDAGYSNPTPPGRPSEE